MKDHVLLVEDDIPTRQWLSDLLARADDVVLAHACGTVHEALTWLRGPHRTDIVLTDLGLPDGSGLEIVREASRQPGREALVLSIFGDEKNVLSAIDAGAGGYLLKDGSEDSIVQHLHCLRSGGAPLSPRIARTLIRRTRSPQPPSVQPPQPMAAPQALPNAGAPTWITGGPVALLTEREADVLIGIGKGFSYAEVAQALNVTINTVRTHVRKIYEKLAVNSRTEAIYEYNRRMVQQGRPPLS